MSRTMAPVDEQLYVLMSGVEYGDDDLKVAFTKELRALLEEDRPLRVYLGIDPTATSLTLGHMVPLRKLRQFQEFGHNAIFLIGDYTALIGDPSDKNKLRPLLDSEDIKRNEATYFEQVSRMLDASETELRHNSEWLSELSFKDVISLTAKFTVAEMLRRDNFRKRFEASSPIHLHEFLYALMQGYDAMALECDVQVGGTEQLFNLMAGRKLQVDAGQRAHVPVTLPILVGLDGKARMSKSTGNFIAVDDTPEDQYGKTMSLPDDVIGQFFMLATNLDRTEVLATIEGLSDGSRDPMTEKKRLARTVVAEFHGEDGAQAAEHHFQQTIQQRQVPDDMPEIVPEDGELLLDLIVRAGATKSKREARRLCEQGAVSVDGERVEASAPAVAGTTVQVGKRRWIRIAK